MRISGEKAARYETLRRDIASSGTRVLLLSSPSEWPQVYSIVRDTDAARIRVYLWDVTYDKARFDYKFQLTSVTGNRFEFEDDVRTIVLGYYAPMGLYLAADAERRRARFGASPAIQVRQAQLDDANRDGITAFTKQRTGETAIVVRRDLIATYLMQADALHDIGNRASGVADINAIASQIGAAPTAPPILTPRDRKVVTVTKAIRSANFQKRVFTAYEHRCCVCDLQLELVEAAHIVPAGAALSSDDTRNGLCLCSIHHDAYDDGLLGIKPDYSITVSAAVMARHTAAQRDSGAPAFQSALRPAIALPYDRASHPDPRFLRLGLVARNWRP